MQYQALFLALVSLILLRFLYLVAVNRAWNGTISALIAILYAFALFIPAQLQSAGLIKSKLIATSILGPPQAWELESLSTGWCIELLVVLAVEVLVVAGDRLFFNVPIANRSGKQQTIARRAAIILLAVGVVASVAFPAGAIEDRGQEAGQGIFVLLRSCLVVGLAVLAFHKFFGSRLLLLVGIVGVAFLVAGSVRSPLLVVMLGYVAGTIARRELTIRSGLGFAAMGAALAIAGAFMSSYRGALIQGYNPDAAVVLAETIQQPFINAYQSGIDTLDGYRLSEKVQPGETADPANLLVAFTTFIPRAVWPSKPADLSIRITAAYLKWGAGGAFLSPIGYLRIALGGYVPALVGWACLVFALTSIYVRQFRSIVGMFTILAAFRLTLAGSPFDVYYVLSLALLYGIARVPVIAFRRIGSSSRHYTHRNPQREGSHRMAAGRGPVSLAEMESDKDEQR